MKIMLCTAPCEPFEFLKKMGRTVRAGGELPVTPKVAIISLIRWMEKQGYPRSDCEFLDIDMLLPSDGELLEYFRKFRPDVIGISAVTSGGYRHVKHIASIAKSVCPDSLVVLGGNLSASANLVLRKAKVDLCVVGDGEIAWVKLLDQFKLHGLTTDNDNLKEIPGLAYLNNDDDLVFTGYGERLSEQEMDIIIDYGILKSGLQGQDHLLANYFRPGRACSWFNRSPRTHEADRKPNVASIIVSKGCVAKCTFCQRATKGYRQASINKMEEHLACLINEFDVGFIHIVDENFGSDKLHTNQFVELMKKYDLLWSATGVRCDSVSHERVKYYSDNNCVSLKFGVESGSQKILDLMEKRFTTEEVKKAIIWCSEFSIYSPLALMFGMPGETLKTAKETGRFLADIALGTNTLPFADDVFYLIPFPGTPAYEYGQQVGVLGKSLDEEEDYLLSVSSAPTHKLSYTNLNGAPLSEVLFWDVLAQCEAMRYYVKDKKNYSIPVTLGAIPGVPAEMNNAIFAEKISAILKRKLLARKWRLSFLPYVSMFIKKKIATSQFVAKIPRGVVYPIIRSLLLIEHYVMSYMNRNEGCYRSWRVKKCCPRIADDYRDAFPDKNIVSLRTITSELRGVPQNTTEQSVMHLKRGN
ncbi:MAG: radical SAM protein [Verrucomicrobiae bacterium]